MAKAEEEEIEAGIRVCWPPRLYVSACQRAADACFSLVHKTDGTQDIDLHLEKSAAERFWGRSKAADAWVDAFNYFLK